jgi:hypothetical protein
MVDTAYQLKVTLRHIHPPIWRRLRVPGAATLGQVHDALQVVLGWTNSHMHQFVVGRDTFGMPGPEDMEPRTTSERSVRLDQVARLKSRLVYEYDFGDGWEHDVLVERVDPAKPADLIPVCLDGRRTARGLRRPARLREPGRDPRRPEAPRARTDARVGRSGLAARAIRHRVRQRGATCARRTLAACGCSSSHASAWRGTTGERLTAYRSDGSRRSLEHRGRCRPDSEAT